MRPDHGCSARNSRASDYNLASPGRRESKMAAGGRVVLPVVGWLRGWLTGWPTRTGRSRKRSRAEVGKGDSGGRGLGQREGGSSDASHNPLRVERTLALPHEVQEFSISLSLSLSNHFISSSISCTWFSLSLPSSFHLSFSLSLVASIYPLNTRVTEVGR